MIILSTPRLPRVRLDFDPDHYSYQQLVCSLETQLSASQKIVKSAENSLFVKSWLAALERGVYPAVHHDAVVEVTWSETQDNPDQLPYTLDCSL